MSEKKYLNRDLSWLSFNERVLQEAEDTTNSLNERLKFLAIFSSNLDEFYRVRVSKLREFRKLQKNSSINFKEKPKKIIKEIQKRVDKLQHRFGHIFKEKLIKELEKEGVHLILSSDFSTSQKAFSETIFKTTIEAHIKIFDLNKVANLDFIQDKSLFFFCNAKDAPILISIPTKNCNRFVSLPSDDHKKHMTYLDEIIRVNSSKLVPNIEAKDLFSVKITRDGELYYEEDEDVELVNLIKESLKNRDQGIPTRLLYDTSIPKEDLRVLRKTLNLKKTDLMPGGRFHNFSDFFQFPDIESRLAFKSNEPMPHYLETVSSVMQAIREKDELLAFPYQKYDTVLRLLDEASEHESVTHVYITLYRVSKDSSVANGLIKCLANNKKVTVFVEAKARFDEENNIEWGEKLAKMGANVLYSMPDLNVHSKILLVETKLGNIGYIGTGNFNEKSAKIYTDFALLTADEGITSDLKEVFSFLLDRSYKPQPKNIWMSPFTTRQQLYEKIDREIEISKSGGRGLIFFKMNSLEDKEVIDKLYEASLAKVEVHLLVRGICCLNPDLEKLGDNITVKSIVGKYLEHSRVYVFGNNGNKEMFIGSADCMGRNLDKRVEVITPIYNKHLKNVIQTCLDLQWDDNTKARIIDAAHKNSYQTKGKSPINAQQDFREYLLSQTPKTESIEADI